MAKASAIKRMPDHRRLGTLIAFVLNLEAIALDDALDLLDILINRLKSFTPRQLARILWDFAYLCLAYFSKPVTSTTRHFRLLQKKHGIVTGWRGLGDTSN